MTLMLSPFRKTLLSFGVLVAASACDSADSDGDSVTDIGATAAASLIPSVASGASLTAPQVEAWDNAISPIALSVFENTPVTPWSDVPTSGSAEVYVGGMEIVPNGIEEDRIFGTMNAMTNFATAEITGSATNFFSSGGEAHSGPNPLTLLATFDRSVDLNNAFGISGTLFGTLDGSLVDGPVNVDIAADFADSGTVIYGVGTGTAGSDNIEAAFILSQD